MALSQAQLTMPIEESYLSSVGQLRELILIETKLLLAPVANGLC